MHVAASSTLANTFDGSVDPGLEQQAAVVVRDAHQRRSRTERGAAESPQEDLGAEAAAHALLRLIADHPGHMGRLRAARVIGGYTVQYRDEREATRLMRYAIQLDWPLREIVRLVDSVLEGGLVAQTAGPRPVLVLTRSGYAALSVLDGVI